MTRTCVKLSNCLRSLQVCNDFHPGVRDPRVERSEAVGDVRRVELELELVARVPAVRHEVVTQEGAHLGVETVQKKDVPPKVLTRSSGHP